MALTPTVHTSVGGGIVVSSSVAPDTFVGFGGAMVVGNFPTAAIFASAGGAMVATAHRSTDLAVSLAGVMVVARGRVASPRLRVWTFQLDDHRFYGIDLGLLEKTLVFDMHSKAWAVWGSGDSDWWRARIIRNWLNGRRLAPTKSAIIAGDDTTGMLYWLNPDGDSDSAPSLAMDEPVPFVRTVTGQVVIAPGYGAAPCFGVQLEGSLGSLAGDNDVTLAISDDRGNNYWSPGSVTLTGGAWGARAHWRSLGAMRQPGRLFRVTDTGALKRLDRLWMDEPR